ncbi:tryptophan synthase subunit alpha [Streptomyces sp. NPDC090493]|uniref:tryptophan synthase subunit alpha n=1 Tax=Streptomyces sp. NPDC090493 TaxID=3365964 RepID=UPI003826C95B
MLVSPRSWAAARLAYALETSSAEQRAALGLYLPVGYPTHESSLDALHLMAQSADILELGVPHPEPHLDGPVIARAGAQALDNGFRMDSLFATAIELTASTTVALLVMAYWSSIEDYGPLSFARRLAAAGGAGVLVPDLPPAAASAWQRIAHDEGLYTITLIPPHASTAQLTAIGAQTSGMVYAPATPGLTGTRRPLSPHLPRLVGRLRTATRLPVAVGIGIGTPDQAAQASSYADAVVVGSAVIRYMQAQPNRPALAAADAARDFAAGVRRAQRPSSGLPACRSARHA